MRVTNFSALAIALLTHPTLHADESLNRAKATLRRMQSVGTAIAAYMTDYNKAPEASSIEALVPLLVPTYSRELPVVDGWHMPFRYVRTGTQSFRIVSAGADKKFDEKSGNAKTETANLNADAVYAASKLYEAGAFERKWTGPSGNALVLSEEEAQEAAQPFVDAELEKMKAMSPEQSRSYLHTSSTNMFLNALATGLEAYKRKHGRYPVVAAMNEVERALYPEFLSDVPKSDWWGTELRYLPSKDGRSYRLISAGADRAFDEASWRKGPGVLALDDEDAVIENGQVVRYWDQSTIPGGGPEGAARRAMQPAARTLLERADARAEAKDFAGALEAYMEAVKADRAAADLERLRRYEAPFAGFRVSEANTARDAAEEALAAKARAPYIAALRQHLDIHPADMEAVRDLVNVLEPKDAEAFLAPLIQTRPRDAELYALRATVRSKAARWLPALEDLDKARDLDASNAERHYVAGVVAYEAVKGESNLTPQKKQEVIPRGIAALERAEGLRDGYFEAMVYRSLLLREQARWASDSASQAKLIAESDALRERAKSLVTAKRSQVAPAPAAEVQEPPATKIPGGPLRVGGDVKAPVLLTRVEPIYPEEAKAHRIAGIVIVETVIDKSGRVVDAKELKGLPYGVGAAALEAVRQWTFRPGTCNGQPVDVIFNLTVDMRLPQ